MAEIFDLIPFSVALQAWQALPLKDRLDEYDPSEYQSAKDAYPGGCPVCHAPQGERGFVRMHFPPGHQFFGRAICCPRCWPPPFGNNTGTLSETLSETAQQIARLWRL